MNLLKLAINISKEKNKKALNYFSKTCKQKYFNTLQLKLIPKILQKSQIHRFRKQSLKNLLLNTLKAYHKYKLSKSLLNPFHQYHKRLYLKVLFSLKVRVIQKNQSKSLNSRIKWVLFDRNCRILHSTFKYWKFIHRIRLILIAQVFDKLEKSVNKWKMYVFEYN